MSFIGLYQHTIDAKNRICLPAKIKSTLDQAVKLYLTIGVEGNIEVYLPSAFEAYMNKIASLPSNNANARKFVRFVTSNSYPVDIDSSNRILVPQSLVEKAKLTKDIYIIGNIDKYEIWSKTQYDEYIKDAGDSLDDLVKDFSGF